MATADRSAEHVRALEKNVLYTAQSDRSRLPSSPRRKLAVVACMDARLTVEETLGLRTGDAHIIRNAGGLATDDAIRSLVISQHLLGTEEIVVLEHTGCGMLTFQDEAVHRDLVARTGADVDLPLLAFPDLEANLRSQIDRIRTHPWIKDVPTHGLVYEIETGHLREVV
ncbi:MAG: beta-class carbonic anhydrase [Acidimicrobiales bacterium]